MGKTVDTKRKKKGRPSLLDLQKRSLRLQQQQQKKNPNPNPSPSPNPYVRFPNTGAGQRRTRRNPITEPEAEVREEEGEEEEAKIGKRREKKLKLVLTVHGECGNSPPHLGPSDSESEREGSGLRARKKIEAVGGEGHRLKMDRHSSLKATESLRAAETSNPGPTTPLPDKKLLLFILDMLQKKDTYGVFSEPVDPEELPDYHEVIEYPMDFSTVRKKLSRGAYKNLEQFEKDIYLISSNGMSYNASDTIYYRQARTIQDHAKKNFENLRQESDKEPEIKTVVRRGRPPNKNINRPVGSPPAATGFSSDAILANARSGANLLNLGLPLSKKGPLTDKPGSTDMPTKVPYGLRSSNSFGWVGMNKIDASEDYSGFTKEITTRFGKKAAVMEENRRNTYSQFQPYNYGCEMPILTLFDGEKKQLDLVGVHMEHAYARSLARFAAQFGSIGWSIAAKKIERVLPPGMKYGRGWVGDHEALHQSQSQILSSSPSKQSSQPMTPPSTTQIPECNSKPSQNLEPSCSDQRENNEDRFVMPINGAGNENQSVFQPKTPFQVHSTRGMQSTANGFSSGFRFNMPSQSDNMSRPLRPPSCFNSEIPMIHPQEREMAQSTTTPTTTNNNNNNTTTTTTSIQMQSTIDSDIAGTSKNPFSFSKPAPEHDRDSQWRGSPLEPIQPDLNVRFQSPASPSSGAMVDSQQPDLALQL